MLIGVKTLDSDVLYVNTDCVAVLNRQWHTITMADGTEYMLTRRSFGELLKAMSKSEGGI